MFLSTLSLRRATCFAVFSITQKVISIHALLAESDLSVPETPTRVVLFLSTLSLRRATNALARLPCVRWDFYPRSPCGERPQRNHHPAQALHISIHALLAESDAVQLFQSCHPWHFYPRSPCGERLRARAAEGQSPEISIHALLAESDSCISTAVLLLCLFLSTLSLRRATNLAQQPVRTPCHFYPRSPCGERQVTVLITASPLYFYPRSPCGERP